MLEMEKAIAQMVENTFFRVYSSMYMKLSPHSGKGVSCYGYMNELLQIWEGGRFISYHEVVSTKCLPACSCLMVNSG